MPLGSSVGSRCSARRKEFATEGSETAILSFGFSNT